MAGKRKTQVKRTADGRFAPGQSGNPDACFQAGNPGGPGRPRDFATEFKEYTGQGRDFAMRKAKECASNGDWRAVQYLLDRFYGKMADKIEHTVRQELEVRFALEIRQAIQIESNDSALADRVMLRLSEGGEQ